MPAQGNAPTHNDPGVQPERTDLAWGRTTLSMVAAAAIFLRWLPHHGWFASTLVAAAVVTALAINLTRKRRFNRAVHGIQRGRMAPDVASTAAVAAMVVILSAMGIYTVTVLSVT